MVCFRPEDASQSSDGMVVAARTRLAHHRCHPGLSLLELLLVTAALGLLVAILLVVLGPARKSARMASCTSHLRQLGLAFRMYQSDYGLYPNPYQLKNGGYLQDRRLLFCPEDTTLVAQRASSSYLFRLEVPPQFTLLTQVRDLDPHVVLLDCESHLERRTIANKKDETLLTPPRYPYHLVLRAGGTVQRIHHSQMREFVQPGDEPMLRTLYPGEPGYDGLRHQRAGL